MADSSTTFSQDAVEARSLLNELGEIFKSLKDENTKFKKDINDIHQRTAPRLESEQVIENDNDVNDIVDIDESDNDVIDEDEEDIDWRAVNEKKREEVISHYAGILTDVDNNWNDVYKYSGDMIYDDDTNISEVEIIARDIYNNTSRFNNSYVQ